MFEDDEFPKFNHQIKIFDYYLCKIVHNPIVSSVVLAASLLVLNIFQLAQFIQTQQFEFLFVNDYYLDLIQNLVNAVFLIRFSSNIPSNVYLESLLFGIQNIACFVLIFNPNYSLLYTDMNYMFKTFIIWQNLCPYIILAMNLFEMVRKSRSNNDIEKLDETQQQPFNLAEFLTDSNNNFLPIFIAHSYLLINFNFPLVFNKNLSWVIFIYKLSSFSIKFYCIYQFILYELSVVIFKSPHIKDYSVFYNPIQLNMEKSQYLTFYDNNKNYFLYSTVGLVIMFDLIYIGLYHLHV